MRTSYKERSKQAGTPGWEAITIDGDKNQGGICGWGEKSDYRYILKNRPTVFPDELDMAWEK